MDQKGALMRSAAWSRSLGRSSLVLAVLASVIGVVDPTVSSPVLTVAGAAGAGLPGRLVYQTTSTPFARQIASIDPNRSPSLPIWASGTISISALAWSPAGDRLAFADNDSSSPGPPKSEIHT